MFYKLGAINSLLWEKYWQLMKVKNRVITIIEFLNQQSHSVLSSNLQNTKLRGLVQNRNSQ